MRIATFDIETTGLDASYGRCLCACFKFQDEDKPRSFTARRYKDEPKVLRQIAKAYDDADVIVTWNGKRFDLPFVNARLMIRRFEQPKGTVKMLDPKKMHVDLMYMSAKLRTRGNRMDGAAKDLKSRSQKFNCTAEHWVRAADGDREAFDDILKHCQLDVLITEDLLDILKPHIVHITR